MHNHLESIIENVPIDYYQNGVKNNFLQKYWHSNKLKNVLKYIDSSPRKVLDMGCASGWFVSEIQKKYPNSDFYGIDIYDEAIRYANKLYPQIKFSVSDAHKTKYENDFFDLIISTEVIEHLEDPKIAIKEMKRILKKNGQLIIEVDSGSVLFSIVWYLWRKINGKVWNDSHLHSFNVAKLENIAKELDFKIEKKNKFNFGMAMIFSLKK